MPRSVQLTQTQTAIFRTALQTTLGTRRPK